MPGGGARHADAARADSPRGERGWRALGRAAGAARRREERRRLDRAHGGIRGFAGAGAEVGKPVGIRAEEGFAELRARARARARRTARRPHRPGAVCRSARRAVPEPADRGRGPSAGARPARELHRARLRVSAAARTVRRALDDPHAGRLPQPAQAAAAGALTARLCRARTPGRRRGDALAVGGQRAVPAPVHGHAVPTGNAGPPRRRDDARGRASEAPAADRRPRRAAPGHSRSSPRHGPADCAADAAAPPRPATRPAICRTKPIWILTRTSWRCGITCSVRSCAGSARTSRCRGRGALVCAATPACRSAGRDVRRVRRPTASPTDRRVRWSSACRSMS